MQFPLDRIVKFAKKNGHLPIIFLRWETIFCIFKIVKSTMWMYSNIHLSKQVIPYSVTSKFLVPTMRMYFNIDLVTKFVVFIQYYEGKLIKLLYAVYASMLRWFLQLANTNSEMKQIFWNETNLLLYKEAYLAHKITFGLASVPFNIHLILLPNFPV